MCNLYSTDTGLDAIRSAVRQLSLDLQPGEGLGNFAGIGRLYPDQDGVIVRREDNGLRLSSMRWGFPPAPTKDKPKSAKPITNIRNLDSGWWRNVNGEYLREPQYRCLVPFTRFAEPLKGRVNAWFALPGQEIGWFAGVWRPWHGERLAEVPGEPKRKRVEQDWRLYAFLTTSPNSVVKPIHPRAMPVILTEPAECLEWLAGGDDSLRLQRPLSDERLQRVE